jgi:phytoene dehydrogenase-like protein
MIPSGAFDAILIGGGHNGLTAAGYLARGGLRVLILERSAEVGGMCQTAEVLPGFRGNMAANSPHNLDPQISADMELERHGLEWIDIGDPSSFALLPDSQKLVAYRDPAKHRAEFERFSARDADGYAATMAEMVELGRKLNVSFFGPPPRFADIAQRVAPGREEEFFGRVMLGSATEVASERIESEHVRSSLGMLAVAGNFTGPSTPGSAYALMQRPLYRGASVSSGRPKTILTAEFGSRTPRGGMGEITQAMKRSVLAAGVSIRTESLVSEIRCTSDGVEGVVLDDGEELRAPVVVSNVNPKTTLLDLVPGDALEAGFRASLNLVPMRGCMAKIYLGLDGEPRFAAAKDAEENRMLLRCGFRAGPTLAAMDRAYHLAMAGDWSGEPIVYGLVQSSFDPGLVPEGKHLLNLSVSYAPFHLARGTWRTERDAWIKHVVRWLTQHIPNLEDLIVEYGALTTQDLHDDFGLLEGNALHGDVTAARMFTWRPVAGHSDYTTPIPGLYLCGNGTWPAHYVSGLPGRNAGLKILSDLRAASADRPRARTGVR